MAGEVMCLTCDFFWKNGVEHLALLFLILATHLLLILPAQRIWRGIAAKKTLKDGRFRTEN